MRKTLHFVCALCSLATASASASDWPRFRGNEGSGVNTDAAPAPLRWSPTDNIKWKVELPGPGSSSPIIIGDRVIVTCWSGYGISRENPGEQSQLKRHILSFDRKTGEQQWSREIAPYLPEDNYGGMFAEHGYATHTPVSDGQNVYAFFGKTGVVAFSLNGEQLWQRSVGTASDSRDWGSASSPILYKNLLIVTAGPESHSLVALDKSNGEIVWQKEAEGLESMWGTPLIVDHAGQSQLVIGVSGEVWGMQPETGKLLWYCSKSESNGGQRASVIANGDVVYSLEGRGGTVAVRLGGEGDVTNTNQVVWKGQDGSGIPTPLYYEGRIYILNGTTAVAINAESGERVYQARLQPPVELATSEVGAPRGGAGGPGGGGPGGGPGGRGGGGFGGQDYGSPVIANGHIYFTRRSGETYVIKAGAEYEQVAVNRVTTDREDFSASPAISDGQLFIRSSKSLYCISE